MSYGLVNKQNGDIIPYAGNATKVLPNASQVSYDNTDSELNATQVQDAIDELKEIIDSNPGTTYTLSVGTGEDAGKVILTPSTGNPNKITVPYASNSGTVNGKTVESNVPSNAVFTDTTYTFANGTNGFTVTPSGGSVQTVSVSPSFSVETGDSNGQVKINGTNASVKGLGSAAYTNSNAYAAANHSHNYAGSDSISGPANVVKGAYTSSGGQQNPNYFGVNKVGFLMMNTSVNGDNNYKDWIIMDCYSGNDVGGGVAFGVNRQKLGAYIMRSDAARTSWSQSAELLGTHNYTSYCATANHGHGLLHNDFTAVIANTTSDSGWSMINPSYNGFLLKSIRFNGSSPSWGIGGYGSGIAFGGADTKGIVSVAYGGPNIRFAGGNGTKPVWWMGITGDSGTTYNLSQLATKTDISSLRSSFQAGVDSIYNAIKAQGTTPASKSLSDVVNAIGTMSNNRYNSGYNKGVSDADGRSNPSSYNYQTGYNAGYSAGSGASKSVPYNISLDGDSSGNHKVNITFGNTKVVDNVRVYYSDDLERSGNITY